MKTRVLRWIEFIILFFGIPLFIWLDRDFIHPSIIIVPVLLFVFILLRRTTGFQWKELLKWGISKRELLVHGGIFLFCSLLAFAYVYHFAPDDLFNLPRAHILIYLAMIVFYPVFSAFGQEIIYRVFLHKRYAPIFPRNWQFVLAGGITFSFMHIVYYDPVSMILTLVGGLYFSQVYSRTGSVLFTSVLHGMYGIMIFGMGLGQYFWLDMPV